MTDNRLTNDLTIDEIEIIIANGEAIGMPKQRFWVQLLSTMRREERLRKALMQAIESYKPVYQQFVGDDSYNMVKPPQWVSFGRNVLEDVQNEVSVTDNG